CVTATSRSSAGNVPLPMTRSIDRGSAPAGAASPRTVNAAAAAAAQVIALAALIGIACQSQRRSLGAQLAELAAGLLDGMAKLSEIAHRKIEARHFPDLLQRQARQLARRPGLDVGDS